MDITQTIALKNQFDIYVMDAVTGETKTHCRSYNTILEKMFTRLCSFSPYFTNVQLGSGSGAIDTSRVKLFNRVVYKTAQHVVAGGSVETNEYYIEKKCTIGQTEFNGTVFTEVGIGYGAGDAVDNNIVTHSLLKDFAGNPITITKNPDEVIEVHATVFIKLVDANSSFRFTNLPDENWLLRYFFLNTKPSANIQVGGSKILPEPTDNSYIRLYYAKDTEWIADVQNRTARTAPINLDYGDVNMPLWEVGLANICRLSFPCDDVGYAGYQFNDVQLSQVNSTDFMINTEEVNQVLDIKKDGIAVSPSDFSVLMYTDEVGERLPIYISLHPELEKASITGVCLSPDSRFLAVVGNKNVSTNSGFVYIYQFDKLSGRVGLRVVNKLFTEFGNIYSVSIDKTGSYIALGCQYSSTQARYLLYRFNKLTGTIGDKIETPILDNVSRRIKRVEFSSDSRAIIAVSSINTLYMHEFDPVTGAVGNAITLPISANVTNFDFSPNLDYFAISLSTAQAFRIYKYDAINRKIGDMLAIPADCPQYCNAIRFIGSDKVILGMQNNDPYLIVYNFNETSGVIGTRIDNSHIEMPPYSVRNIEVSKDNLMLAILDSASKTWHFYAVYKGLISHKSLSADTDFSFANVQCVSFDNENNFMFSGLTLSSQTSQCQLRHYVLRKNKTKIIYPEHENKMITATYNVLHIPKTNQNRVNNISFSIVFGEYS